MNRETFKELTGENPEDVLGMDWANEYAEWDEEDIEEDDDEEEEDDGLGADGEPY